MTVLNPEEFFPQADSLYIRIQYVSELDGFKFSIWNELISPEDIANNIAILGRGMTEFCILNPAHIAGVGAKAIVLDAHFNNKDNRLNMMMSAKPVNKEPI